MMPMTSATNVSIPKDRVALELLTASGLNVNPEEVAKFEFKAAEAMEAIAAHSLNDGLGPTRLQVGRTHIRLTRFLWDLSVNVVVLGLAAHEPSGLTFALVAGKALESLSKVAELVHRLDDEEMRVYKVVVDLAAGNRSIEPSAMRARELDIIGRLEAEDMPLPNVALVISRLADKHAIRVSGSSASEVYYEPTGVLD
jgi:hypothetical protein